MKFVSAFLIVFVAFAACKSVGMKVDPRIYEDMSGNGEKMAGILVRMREKVDLEAIVAEAKGDHRLKGDLLHKAMSAHARKSQEKLVALLLAHNAAIQYQSYWISNVVVVRNADLLLVKRIIENHQHDVAAIESNRAFKVPLEEPEELLSADQMSSSSSSVRDTEWNVEWVNADIVWQSGNVGQLGVVMNADTGVEFDHPEIYPAYRGLNGSLVDHNYNWWDGIKVNSIPGNGVCGVNSPVPCDDNNHGTHTTGTAVGVLGCGVAPGAKWVACRNMDRGYGTPESYISCLQWAMAPTDLNGNNPNAFVRPHAIGNSYGCTSGEGCVYDSLHDAVEAVRASGIVMAVSSGNSGSSCDSINDPPGLEPSVIAVGATGFQSNTIATYSSRGPVEVWGGSLLKPELVAPGSSVRSCVRNGGYGSYSGTSMASPHVNGAVALIVTACPSFAYNVDAIQAVLEQSALALYSNQGCGGIGNNVSPNHVYGYGQIVLDAAIALCSTK